MLTIQPKQKKINWYWLPAFQAPFLISFFSYFLLFSESRRVALNSNCSLISVSICLFQVVGTCFLFSRWKQLFSIQFSNHGWVLSFFSYCLGASFFSPVAPMIWKDLWAGSKVVQSMGFGVKHSWDRFPALSSSFNFIIQYISIWGYDKKVHGSTYYQKPMPEFKKKLHQNKHHLIQFSLNFLKSSYSY